MEYYGQNNYHRANEFCCIHVYCILYCMYCILYCMKSVLFCRYDICMILHCNYVKLNVDTYEIRINQVLLLADDKTEKLNRC